MLIKYIRYFGISLVIIFIVNEVLLTKFIRSTNFVGEFWVSIRFVFIPLLSVTYAFYIFINIKNKYISFWDYVVGLVLIFICIYIYSGQIIFLKYILEL